MAKSSKKKVAKKAAPKKVTKKAAPKKAAKKAAPKKKVAPKNRFGIDGLQFKVHLDTARSKIRVLSNAEVEDIKNDNDIEKERIQNDTVSRFKAAIKKSKEDLQLSSLSAK